MRGTMNTILNSLFTFISTEYFEDEVDSLLCLISASRRAHSNAISVFPVPVLYIIEPLNLFSSHASTASC